MGRNILTVAVAIALAGNAGAQPAPKNADDKSLVTKVYDLQSVLGEKGKANGFADMDAVIKVILETLPLADLKPGAGGPQLVVRDGGRLELRASAKVQDEVGDLIAAMARLADVAVDVDAEVVELDPAAFEKLTKSLATGKPGSPVLFAVGEEIEGKEAPAADQAFLEMNKLLKAGKVVQASTARFVNGAEAVFSARQSVLTFHSHAVNEKPVGVPQFVKEGFTLLGIPVVSADRRFVRLKLAEQSVAVTGMRKREIGEVKGQKMVAETPRLDDLGSTASALVADGGTLLFRLAYAPKDKVWVVVLRPRVFIQAEQNALKKP